jgi:hypothetical protein
VKSCMDLKGNPVSCSDSSVYSNATFMVYRTLLITYQLANSTLQLKQKRNNGFHIYGMLISVDNFLTQEPDLWKCQHLPYYCFDQLWPKQVYNIQIDKKTGLALPAAKQMTADPQFVTDKAWQKSVNKLSPGIANLVNPVSILLIGK